MLHKNDDLKSDVMEELLRIELPEKMGLLYSHESPLDKPVHGMPRLNVLLENTMVFRLWKEGRICEYRLEAPAFYYCTADGFQWAVDSNQPRKAVSFCYFREYIRVVIYRSKSDITCYHSTCPLSPGAWQLIEAVETLHKEAPGAEERLIPLLKALFDLTCFQLGNDPRTEPKRRLNRTWNRINTYLRAHRTENLSREKIASLFQLSPGSLSRLAKKYTGMKFSKLRIVYKLELADELLRSTDLNIDEIADECGFNYTSYFHRCYLEYFGITPKRRREEPEGDPPRKQ